MTRETEREDPEILEEAAWRGKKRSERRNLIPLPPYQKFDIRGYVPDVKVLGSGIVLGIVGVAGIAFGSLVVVPEWNNLAAAATCVGDCGISKITVFAVGAITLAGGALCIAAGVANLISGLGFVNENEIQVDARKAR
jgi:hypothetical protein